MAVASSAEAAPRATKAKQDGRRRRKKIHASGTKEGEDSAAATPTQAGGETDGADTLPTRKRSKTVRRKKKATGSAPGEPVLTAEASAVSAGTEAAGPVPDRETKARPPAAGPDRPRKTSRRRKKVARGESATESGVPAPPARAPAPATSPEALDRDRPKPPPPAPAEAEGEPAFPRAGAAVAEPVADSAFGFGIFEPEPAPGPVGPAEPEEPPPPRMETPSQKRRRRRRRSQAARAAAQSPVAGGSSAARPAEPRSQPPASPTAEKVAAGPTAKAVAPRAPAPAASGTPTDGAGSARSRRRRKRRRPATSPPGAEPEAEALDAKPEPGPDEEPDATPPDLRIWAPPSGKAAVGKGRGREMVINVTGDDECRVAILNDGRLEELFIERQSAQSHVGNIYKGRITNVEPSIQAAFVDFGFPKNGFLHVSDVQPQYFPNRGGASEAVGKKVPRRDRPPIQRCFRRGQEVIVQITKEGVGTKGPTLTTYLSIPGRFLVMMPGMDKVGLSRKIEDEEARRKMREVMNQLTFPDNIGFILRTAGLDQSKRELQRDLNYLMRLWKTVSDRIRTLPPPAELYQDSDLVTRTLRDVYTSDFERIVVDHAETGHKALDFLRIAAPRSANNVELFTDTKPIFHTFGIEEQIDLIHSRHVPLPSGGTLVIDSTEAMVTIDVNSGKFRELDDAEETAYKINMEAAEEIARQLRLRDLGGLIVCDFIDMRFDRHKRAVEKVLRDALKKHKERARILRMSQFGLIEMTRQRQRPSIRRGTYSDCPHCRGSGQIKTPESMSLEVMRILQLAAHSRDVFKITLTAAPRTALMVLNERRAALHQLQQASGKTIIVQANPDLAPDQIQCQCEDNRGRPLNFPG